MTPDELIALAQRIKATLFDTPRRQRLDVLKGELKRVPVQYRGAIETLVLTIGVRVGREAEMKKTNWQMVAAVTIGVVTGVALFCVAVLIREPSQFQKEMFWFFAAIAGALVAALLPGAFEMNLTIWKNIGIRATAAFGVFALVYNFRPGSHALFDRSPSSMAPASPSSEVAAKPSPASRTISVSEASYGLNRGNNQAGNATDFVKRACDGEPICLFSVAKAASQIGDHFPGQTKDFDVTYLCGDESKTAHVDGESVGQAATLTCVR